MKRDLMITAVGGFLDEFFETHKIHNTTPTDLYDVVIGRVESFIIKEVLKRTRGNQKRTAEILGINRNTLRKKAQELGMVPRTQLMRERSEG